MITVILHVNNEDPVVGEVEELPDSTDQLILVQNPRRRDGSDLHYVQEEVTKLIFPVHRLNFIQVLPSGDVEDVIGFVRE